MIKPQFKFLTKVRIKNHDFLGGHRGIVIGFDQAYGQYHVKLAQGIVKEVSGSQLELLTKRK